MKLWHVEFIIQDKHLHDTLLGLEGKAYNVKQRPLSNGKGEETKAKPKGPSKGLNIKERSIQQQEWIAKHVKGEVSAADLRTDWIKAGYRKTGLYQSLKKAVKDKTIKKTAAGTYKPIGG